MTKGLDTAARDLVDPQFFATLEDLELIARTAVEGFLQGLHRSPYVGFSVEFASHREYLPGDDLRHLNWKLYGRQDKLYVKQYDAEKLKIKQAAEDFQRDYDKLNFRDDQFDMAEAGLSLSIALLGVTALTQKRWLLAVAVIFGALGLVLGVSGFLGYNVHPNFIAKLLS